METNALFSKTSIFLCRLIYNMLEYVFFPSFLIIKPIELRTALDV